MGCETQCCAVTFDNKRCTNETIHSSHHCEVHYPQAMKLYKKYKHYCDVAYNADLDAKFQDSNDQVKYLMKCYNWLNLAYDSRLKHRKYAFVPECYDQGHDYQFQFIKEKLKKCEENMQEIYRSAKSKVRVKPVEIEIEEEEEKESWTEEITDKEKMKKFIKKKQQKREETEEELFSKYIEENRVIIQRKEKCMFLVMENTFRILEDYMDISEDRHFFCIIFHHLCLELNGIGYFDPNFKPTWCRDCNPGCTCNEPAKHEVHLCCKSAALTRSIREYFTHIHEESIKYYCEAIIRYEDKIRPLVEDLAKLYLLFGPKIAFMNVIFTWSPERKRITLIQNPDPQENVRRRRRPKKR